MDWSNWRVSASCGISGECGNFWLLSETWLWSPSGFWVCIIIYGQLCYAGVTIFTFSDRGMLCFHSSVSARYPVSSKSYRFVSFVISWWVFMVLDTHLVTDVKNSQKVAVPDARSNMWQVMVSCSVFTWQLTVDTETDRSWCKEHINWCQKKLKREFVQKILWSSLNDVMYGRKEVENESGCNVNMGIAPQYYQCLQYCRSLFCYITPKSQNVLKLHVSQMSWKDFLVRIERAMGGVSLASLFFPLWRPFCCLSLALCFLLPLQEVGW